MPTLLLNYVYYNPVGHVVEALKVAKGYYEANPGLDVHVLLNQHSPVELAEACHWIARVYAMDTHAFHPNAPPDAAKALAGIPREWDYVVTNDWILDDVREMAKRGEVHRDEASMASFHDVARTAFRARIAASQGDFDLDREYLERIGLRYEPRAQARLSLPAEAVAFAARYAHDGPTICVVLGGSAGPRAYPSARTWVRILRALLDATPNLRLFLTGVRRSERGRTATEAYADRQIATVLAQAPGVVDCYDIGLWRQLALVERCHLFLSPHTGFGFIASCVGTPWLVISGGNYGEGPWNGVPSYSVLPDDPWFPYRGKRGSMWRPGARIRSMREAALAQKVPEIVEGARLLLDPTFTFEAARERHRRNLARANVDPEWKRQRLAQLEPRW